jgi:hypothetical protein
MALSDRRGKRSESTAIRGSIFSKYTVFYYPRPRAIDAGEGGGEGGEAEWEYAEFEFEVNVTSWTLTRPLLGMFPA